MSLCAINILPTFTALGIVILFAVPVDLGKVSFFRDVNNRLINITRKHANISPANALNYFTVTNWPSVTCFVSIHHAGSRSLLLRVQATNLPIVTDRRSIAFVFCSLRCSAALCCTDSRISMSHGKPDITQQKHHNALTRSSSISPNCPGTGTSRKASRRQRLPTCSLTVVTVELYLLTLQWPTHTDFILSKRNANKKSS